jgi:serine/threonine protein kinase
MVKKPEIVQLEINDEMQSNALDVAAQFLAELRVYTRAAPHRNIPAIFLGCLDGIGMVLEFLEGGTLYDYLKQHAPLPRIRLYDFHNQLLDALTHLHAYGLSHGDLSLLNVQVIERRGEQY